MILRELITQIGFDVEFAPLEKLDDKVAETKAGLEGLGAAADEAIENVKNGIKSARNFLLGFSVATAAAGVSLFALVKSAANVGEEINKTAPLLGFSVEEFQKYRYAAKLAGVENENFAGSVQLLLRNIVEANNGNKELVKSFGRAGLSAANLKGLPSDQILRKLSDGLSKIPDQATRVSVSMDLLGRSGARMGMFLAKGTAEMDSIMGDVETFGLFTKETAQQADDFNDALDRVLFFFGGIKNELQGLFPLFTGILNEFREWLTVHREIIKAGLSKGIEILSAAITKAWNLTKSVVNAFETIIKVLGGFENAFWLLGIAIITPLMLLIGPLILLGKATVFLLIPFLRLHTLLALVGFAMSAITPIIVLLTSVLAALAASKIIGFLIQLAGGYRALAMAILGPTLALIAQAAALAVIILLFEDLTQWILGNKSLVGEWFGEWATIPGKFRKLWQEIKDIFAAGGEFISAVFRGDFKEAFRLLNAGIQKTVLNPAIAAGQALTSGKSMPAGRPTFNGAAGGFGQVAGLYSFAGGSAAGGSASSKGGPGVGTFAKSYTMVAGPDGQPELRPRGDTVIKQDVKAEVHVNLPPGSPQEHGEATARAFQDLMDKHINHSLQQSVAPGN